MPKRWTVAVYWDMEVRLLYRHPWWAIIRNNIFSEDKPEVLGYLRDTGQDARDVLKCWEAALR